MDLSQTKNLNRETLSLENCDKEPIHIPGHIQGFASLIATDEALKTITHCSDNISEVFGKNVKDVLSQPLKTLLDSSFLHDINNTLCLSSAQFQRERVGHFDKDDKQFEVWAHVNQGKPIIEFERVAQDGSKQTQNILIVRSLLSRLQLIDDLNRSLNDAAIGLRNLTGFDRVMVYKFDPNGDGEVVAEDCSPDMEPFLGLRFPKWDIPNQARDIMKKLPLRMIANVKGKAVPIHRNTSTTPPLDMTLAACRGQSPIHNEYLENMGVGGTMTLSITVNDNLWGLIAFHHKEPKHIGPNLRGAAELFAQFFSLQMEQRLERDRNIARSTALSHQSSLMEASDIASNLGELIQDIAGPFCKLLEADGLAIITAESVSQHGVTPSPEVTREICTQLLSQREKDIISADSQVELGLKEGNIAGALALRLHGDSEHNVVFFRQEAALSVRWAGAPAKTISEEKDGPRLKPRGSFKAYQQSIKGKCKPWSQSTLLSANEIRLALAKADTALFRRLSQKEERQRSIYIAELNHRVRNILALIRSLSRRAKESSNSLESYAKALEQRITALGAAHDLAANKITDGVSINAEFETEAKPFTSEAQKQLFLTGESFVMRSDVAPIFALVIHELMTNCVKYGAFSSTAGHVHVNVQQINNRIKIVWKELGGPKAEPPTRHGFGLSLIEKAIPYELDGDSQLEFLPEGLQATFWLPEEIVEPLSDALAMREYNKQNDEADTTGLPETVLVIEDSMMIAMDVSDMLKRIGVKTVYTCATVKQAMRVIENNSPDFALLDVSLRDETSFAAAQHLEALKIPFCFATGYGSDVSIADDFPDAVVLTKPVSAKIIDDTLRKLYN